MNYEATLNWLYARLPMFSRIGAAAIKADLINTIRLCEALGNPQRRFPSVHIAGTNGKGSTSHMLAAILSAAGYKTGLYTSPHLVDFRERIRIDGKPVAQDFVVDFVAQHQGLIEDVQPSFFEITVAMAFTAFAEQKVDIAVIETGLGGRLDSTNVITPELSIITNISLDHTDLLGNDIPSIAREKAGIIKPGVPVVTGRLVPDALHVVQQKADELGVPLVEASRSWTLNEGGATRPGFRGYSAVHSENGVSLPVETDLAGSYQQENIATVLTAVDALAKQGWVLNRVDAIKALSKIKKTTSLRGRWDILGERPLVVADVAHNPAGLKAVIDDWARIRAKHRHILLGFVRDKDVRTALRLLPRTDHYHFCAADTPRALPAPELRQIAAGEGLEGVEYPSVKEAVTQLTKVLDESDALLITGSFFIVGEAMQALGIEP